MEVGSVSALALGIWFALGLDAHSFRFKEATKGDVFLTQWDLQSEYHGKTVGGDGTVLSEKQEKVAASFVYRGAILETGDRIRLRRQYEKARVSIDGRPATLPYQGKTVLIDGQEGKYRFRIDGGGELTGQAAAWLDGEFNAAASRFRFEDVLLPHKPVRLNLTWNVDVEAAVTEFHRAYPDFDVDLAKSKGTSTLVKVHEQDGRRFGVVESKLELAIKPGKLGRNTIGAGSRFLYEQTLDVCIDGSKNRGTQKDRLELEVKAEAPKGVRTWTVRREQLKSWKD